MPTRCRNGGRPRGRPYAILLLCATAAWAGSWPGHRRQTDRTGWAVEDAVPPLTQRWTASGSGQGVASPVVWGGRIVAARDDGTLTAYDGSTGGVVWQTNLGARLLATPLIAQGTLYEPTMDGRVVVMEAATGKTLWEIACGGQNGGSPLLLRDGRTLVVSAGAPVNAVAGIDLVGRKVAWQAPLDQPTLASPAWDGARILAAANDGQVRGMSSTGTVTWSAATAGEIFFSVPAAFRNRTYVPSGTQTSAQAFASDSGAPAFTVDSGWDVSGAETNPKRTSSFALARGSDGLNYALVVLKSAQPMLYALDADNLATVRWSVQIGTGPGDSFFASPAVANDVVYAASVDGAGPALYAFTLASGAALGSWPLDGPCLASPAVANGWVYVVTRPGTLYAFEAARAVAVTNPDTEATVLPGNGVPFSALVKGMTPAGYTVEVAPGRKLPDETGFTTVATAGGSADPASLGAWSSAKVGDYTARITVADANGGSRRAMAYFSVARTPVSKFLRAAEGGELVVTTRIKVVFPPRCLSRDGWVTGLLLDEATLAGAIGTAKPVQDTALEVTLESGLTLTSSATVVLGYDPATLAGLEARRIRTYWLDESSGVWKVVGTSKADPPANQVTAQVPHFTKFRAMAYPSGGPLLTAEEVYTVPNPARGDSVLFKFRLNDAADVTIKIFNVAGEQVEELTRSYGEADAGLPRAIPWDLRSAASGVYLYRLEAVSPSRADAVTKKLAVIK